MQCFNDESFSLLSSLSSEKQFRRRSVPAVTIAVATICFGAAILCCSNNTSPSAQQPLRPTNGGLFPHRRLLLGLKDGESKGCPTCQNGGTCVDDACVCTERYAGEECGAYIAQEMAIGEDPMISDGTVELVFSNFLPAYDPPVVSTGIVMFSSLHSFDIRFSKDTILRKYNSSTYPEDGGSPSSFFKISGSNGVSGENGFGQEYAVSKDLDMGSIPAFLAGETYTVQAYNLAGFNSDYFYFIDSLGG